MYAFSFGPQTFDAHRDGRPLSLADCWKAVEGVGAATIWRIRPDGRLAPVLRNAGATSVRTDIRRALSTIPRPRRGTR